MNQRPNLPPALHTPLKTENLNPYACQHQGISGFRKGNPVEMTGFIKPNGQIFEASNCRMLVKDESNQPSLKTKQGFQGGYPLIPQLLKEVHKEIKKEAN